MNEEYFIVTGRFPYWKKHTQWLIKNEGGEWFEKCIYLENCRRSGNWISIRVERLSNNKNFTISDKLREVIEREAIMENMR